MNMSESDRVNKVKREKGEGKNYGSGFKVSGHGLRISKLGPIMNFKLLFLNLELRTKTLQGGKLMNKLFSSVITFAIELETIILLFLRSTPKTSRK